MSNQYRMYTDGGARGNPGPAASGAIIKKVVNGKEELVASASEYLGRATNNQAEYKAVIIGLQKAKEIGVKELDVVMDSELIVKQLNKEYKVKDEKLAKLYIQVWDLTHDFEKIGFRHVFREHNKEADALVNQTIDEQIR
ncbi:MAG: ribonuclease HI family protein [Patescibacteria group bacterium]